ncbi:MAG: hypothetical protein US62_C0025G0003 [Candidatus Woesebacteria bacterium GW2011_GWA1_37_8]|uniref:Uncharacterized protein n=2 Tax=Candidatus Woeseibacteriota TaxID=1752722 RepID=A0A0G0PCG3_9BACT|nr:MAG: hypothetical protein US39_C0008G0010 [Microgenomates group bacterium GW2011_GWC1_37_12b]KKQ44432.1 MAG: hypothetical protein US62_C0025G0003 [Candidatus Woesebacteria bacterium GW2011_GWA1_37_8]KKQ86976.1 MAG: hypothetical protein UT10_C0013G0025 [Candidatus Woesebacteria bacterium GW2011_GWB1_38_8b]
MYKVLLKKSKNELARLIVLLVALVVVLGLLTATKVFKIEKEVTDVSGFTIRPGTDPYEVVEPTTTVVNPGDAVSPVDEFPAQYSHSPKCFKIRTFKICGPYF